MNNLISQIAKLEREIAQGRAAAYQQYEATKNYVSHNIRSKIASPSLLMTAFVTGSLAGRRIKRSFKRLPAQIKTTSGKLSLLQKIMALSSEISVAVKLFNRFKPTLLHLTQKTNARMNVPH